MFEGCSGRRRGRLCAVGLRQRSPVGTRYSPLTRLADCEQITAGSAAENSDAESAG
jgi:hypothetical protein